MATNETTFFSWEAPEFKHYEKNIIWYIFFGIITAILITISAFKQDYFGIVTIVILAGLILFFTRRKPSIVPITITNKGFTVDNTHVPFRFVKQFWIVDAEHHRTINLETNTYLNQTIIIELGDQDPEPIREFLQKVLPEHEEPAPSFSQRIAHRFKF